MGDFKINSIKLQILFETSLLEEHSLSSLIILLDSGREINLQYQQNDFWISQGKNGIVCSLNDECFSDAYNLVCKLKINNSSFIDFWKDVKILTLL